MDKTPREVIDDLGVAVIAAKLGKKPRTVEMWRFRNRLPRTLWPELMQEFPTLNYETLTALEARQGRAA